MKKLIAYSVLLTLVAGLILSGCGSNDSGSTGGASGSIQLDSGTEIKISADGKVTSGDAVLSEGGAGSVATGCEITVKSDGTIIVTTDEGDYSVCKQYELTIPAKKEQVVQVSTPTGETVRATGSGLAFGGVTVQETGAVQMSHGTLTMDAGKVIFSTKQGNYLIIPANTRIRSAGVCQVQKPDGTVVTVADSLTILDGKAKILANGTVSTGEASVSMLEKTATIATAEGIYTVSAEEVVVAEETKVVLPVAVLNPAGEVISTGKAVISDGNITVTENGDLLTSSGKVTVGDSGVTVTPIQQNKTMTLPNGSVIDITDAEILDDGTVVLPETTETMQFGTYIMPERHYSKSGFLTTYDYYASSVNADGILELVKVSKDDPTATHMDVFVYDLHFVQEPMTKHELIEKATNTIVEMSYATLDSQGNVLELTQQPMGSEEYSVFAYDRFGREIRTAHYNPDGTLQKSGITEYTYLVDSPHDTRYASILYYNANGIKEQYTECDANGMSAYTANYDETGFLTGELFYVNGNFYLGKFYRPDGTYDYEKHSADGTREIRSTLSNGNYTVTKYNKNDQILYYQDFMADGSSFGYEEYFYDIDGWISMHRVYKFQSDVLVNQDGSVSGRLNMTEYYESETKTLWIQYNEDGSEFARGEYDKTAN